MELFYFLKIGIQNDFPSQKRKNLNSGWVLGLNMKQECRFRMPGKEFFIQKLYLKDRIWNKGHSLHAIENCLQ
jgi:hypothetical protein